MSKVLAKITPDYLRDTIVEIRYQGALPFSLLRGIFYQELSEDYRLLSNLQPIGTIQLGPQQQVQLSNLEVLDFASGDIKFQLADGRIVFNSLGDYPGWKKYFPKIQAVLSHLIGTGQINRFQRVGIRYISEFPDMEILPKIKVRLEAGFTDAQPFNTTIRSEYHIDGRRAVVNIANNVKKQTPEAQEGIFSIIDIDVIGQTSEGTEEDRLFAEIDHLHTIEKQIFQHLLEPSFLQELDAEYEPKKQ
jgi:uncharacterized protein (TIGR04255 family)